MSRVLTLTLVLAAVALVFVPCVSDRSCHANERNEELKRLREETIDKIASDFSMSSNVLGLVFDLEPQWFDRAGAAFAGWKVGTQLAEGKPGEAIKTVLKFGAEFFVSKTSLGPASAAFSVWVGACQWLRAVQVDRAFKKFYALYAKNLDQQGMRCTPPLWDRNEKWMAFEEKQWEITIHQFDGNRHAWGKSMGLSGGPAIDKRLHEVLRSRYALECGAGRGLWREEFRKVASKIADMKLTVHCSAVRKSDGSPIQAVNFQANASGVRMKPSASEASTATYDIRLAQVKENDRYSFAAEADGSHESKACGALELIKLASMHGFHLKLVFTLDVAADEPTDDLDDDEPPTGSIRERYPLGSASGSMPERRALHETDPRRKEHWKEMDRQKHKTLPLPSPKVLSHVFLEAESSGQQWMRYGVGRISGTPSEVTAVVTRGATGKAVPFENGMVVGPSDRLRLDVRQGSKQTFSDFMLFPSVWLARAYAIPTEVDPSPVATVTSVDSLTDEPDAADAGKARMLWRRTRGRGVLTTEGAGRYCVVQVRLVDGRGRPLRGRTIALDMPGPKLGQLSSSRLGTDGHGLAEFVYMAPSTEDWERYVQGLAGVSPAEVRVRIRARCTELGLERIGPLRVRRGR